LFESALGDLQLSGDKLVFLKAMEDILDPNLFVHCHLEQSFSHLEDEFSVEKSYIDEFKHELKQLKVI
jgi:hypothetical protein